MTPVNQSNQSNQLLQDIREANNQRLSKLEEFEMNQQYLQSQEQLKLKMDRARREAEILSVIQSEEAVNSAKKDPNQLRNIDRPLYDLLITRGSGFKGGSYTDRITLGGGPSSAVPVINEDYLIGDIPRLNHN